MFITCVSPSNVKSKTYFVKTSQKKSLFFLSNSDKWTIIVIFTNEKRRPTNKVFWTADWKIKAAVSEVAPHCSSGDGETYLTKQNKPYRPKATYSLTVSLAHRCGKVKKRFKWNESDIPGRWRSPEQRGVPWRAWAESWFCFRCEHHRAAAQEVCRQPARNMQSNFGQGWKVFCTTMCFG